MEQGWVYILVNPSIPGMVKVGRTTRLPADRMAELSCATGVATPFVLIFEQVFIDCEAAERDIHALLDDRGMRVASNREFFRCSPSDVVRIVFDYAHRSEVPPANATALTAPELMALGDDYLFGQGETLQDIGEAITCYRMAASRGSSVAFERLGAIVAQTGTAFRGSRTRAMGYLREGTRRGNYYCYCEIGAIAAQEGHVSNFIKAWDLFFAHRSTSFFSEVESGADRYVTALQRYVVTCFTLTLVPAHLTELISNSDDLARILTAALDDVRAPEARQSLIVSLRWVRMRLARMPVPLTLPQFAWSLVTRWASVRWRYASAR